jgi:integrase
VINVASIIKRSKTKYSVVCYIDGEQKWSPVLNMQKAKMLNRYLGNFDEVDLNTYQTAFNVIDEINISDLQEKVIQYDDYQKMVNDKLIKLNSKDSLSMKLKDYFWEFANRYGKVKWGGSYFDKCVSNMVNYVFPYLGDIPIDKITVKIIDDHYTFLITKCKPVMCNYRKPLEHLTASLVKDIHKVLRCMFNQAVKWEDLVLNPFLKATLPEYTSKERDSLTPMELQKLLQYLDDENDYNKFVLYCAILLDFACTTRSGEVSAFQWPDFSSEKKELQIYKSYGRIKKKHIELPKSEIYFEFPVTYPGCKTLHVLQKTKTGNERTAYLPNLVIEKLLVLKTRQEELKDILGDEYVDYGLIICQSNGRPISHEYLNKWLQYYLKEIKMKIVVFHSLRTTSATFKLRLSGGDIKSVQGEGGWKDEKMVTKQYSRILEEDRRGLSKEMNKAEFFRGATKNKSQESEDEQIKKLLTLVETNPALFKKLFDSLKTLS